MNELIKGYVEDLIADFLYYDRKEDEDLPRGAIEAAIENKDITIQEIIDQFEKSLRDSLPKTDTDATS